jgi:hypothetical protein
LALSKEKSNQEPKILGNVLVFIEVRNFFKYLQVVKKTGKYSCSKLKFFLKRTIVGVEGDISADPGLPGEAYVLTRK